MTYQNPNLPEGINAENRHPLHELAVAGGIAFASVAVVGLVLFLFGRSFAAAMPLSWERWVADRIIVMPAPAGPASATERALQRSADALAARMKLPRDALITVHLVDLDMANALATLGGHIFVTRKLLPIAPDGPARDFVLAHEIAHVLHRDAVRNIGGAAVLSLSAAVLMGETRSLGELVTTGGALTTLSYQRGEELAADAAALTAVGPQYRDLSPILRLLEAFRSMEGGSIGFLRSHPFAEERVARLRALAQANGWHLGN